MNCPGQRGPHHNRRLLPPGAPAKSLHLEKYIKYITGVLLIRTEARAAISQNSQSRLCTACLEGLHSLPQKLKWNHPPTPLPVQIILLFGRWSGFSKKPGSTILNTNKILFSILWNLIYGYKKGKTTIIFHLLFFVVFGSGMENIPDPFPYATGSRESSR